MNKASKKLLCLINSRSGGNNGKEIAKQLSSLSVSSIDQIVVQLLDESQSFPSAEEIESKYAHVLVAGGDGTFSSVLSRYSGTKIDFLVLPLGTGNDLARELGVKKFWHGDLQSFLKNSLSLPSQPVQVWEAFFKVENENIRSRKFLNYISLGWDGLIVESFDRSRNAGVFFASKFGPWGNRFLYLLAVLRKPFYKLPPLTVETGTEKIKLSSNLRTLLFSNVCSVMGLGKSNFTSNCSDGLLELISLNKLLNYGLFLLPKRLRKNTAIQSDKFKISFNESEFSVPIQIDGEYFGKISQGFVEIVPAGTVFLRFSKT